MRVLISRKPSDYQFVAWAISRHRLSPRVTVPPETVGERSTRRIVEHYQWGQVVFSYGTNGSHCTFVVIFEKSKAMTVQECLGFVAGFNEADAVECHGDGREVKPCSFKTECTAIKETAVRLGLSVEELLLHCSVEEIVQGRAPRLITERREEPHEEARPPKMKHVRPMVRAATVDVEEQLVARAKSFFKTVGESLGEAPASGDSGETREKLKSGQLYTRDRVEKSGYVGLYVYSEDEWDTPICTLRPVPRKLAYHIKLPISSDQLEKLDVENVCGEYEKRPADKLSRFKVEIKGFDQEKLDRFLPVVVAMAKKHILLG